MSTSRKTPIIQWARDLMKAPDQLVILDTETTGLDRYAEIVQITLLDGYGEVLLDTLLKPASPIPPAATNVHGITNAMVQGAPSWSSVGNRVLSLIEKRHVVVYNAAYDRRLLAQTTINQPMFTIHWGKAATWHCAMERYAEYYGDWDDYHGNYRWVKLEAACLQMHIPDPDAPAHSALGDCLRTLALVKALAAC